MHASDTHDKDKSNIIGPNLVIANCPLMPTSADGLLIGFDHVRTIFIRTMAFYIFG